MEARDKVDVEQVEEYIAAASAAVGVAVAAAVAVVMLASPPPIDLSPNWGSHRIIMPDCRSN